MHQFGKYCKNINSVFLICFFCHQQSSRGDTFTAFARVELGQTSLGESSKTECKNGEYEVEFTALLKVAVNNPTSIENLIKQPLLGNSMRVYFS